MSRHSLSILPRRAVVLNLFARKAAPVADLPLQQSRQIAATIPTEAMESTVDRGKHVDHESGPFLALVLPGKFHCSCGERATHIEPGVTRGARPRYYCPAHRPLGITGVVDGGGGDAA